MDSYIDIRVLPDLELSESALLNNLFAKLHRQLGAGDIGVSFPYVSSRLGDTLRIHGNAVRLEQLMQQPWLKGLRDYTETSAVLPVPTEIKGYRSVIRVQRKSASNREKRAVAKRWFTQEEAKERYADPKPIRQPFLAIQSLSTKQHIKIFVKHGPVTKTPKQGTFNSYGMSNTATIPWF